MFLFLIHVPGMFAQLSSEGTITGSVTDATGAVVPGATVVLTNTATQISIHTASNDQGIYVANSLEVATYKVSFSKAGFEMYSVNNVEVHPAVTSTVNAILTVGAATEHVEVQAVSTQIETSSSQLSTEIGGKEVASLPMNGRNFSALVGLLPGVTNTSQGSALTTGGRSTTNSLSVNGLSQSASFYAIDGVWNENTGNMNQQAIVPNPDSIGEVRVIQNNFSAQYSLMGASVILVNTKSGSRDFHGSVWEFLRNDDLNSKPYFSTTIPAYKQNIFGYNIGGPVVIPHFYNTNRSKTFFFWNEQWVILHVPNQVTSIVPTSLQAQGCFGSPIKDPTTNTNFPIATSGTCAGLYQIPANRLNSSSSALLQTLYPGPNFGTKAANATNYINLKPQVTDQRDDEIKVDHSFSSRYHLLAEYFDEYQMYAQNTLSPGATPVSWETDYTHNKVAQISLTQTLTPNMVNTSSVGMNIFLLNLSLQGTNQITQVPNYAETFFYPNASFGARVPQVTLTGVGSLGVTAARPLPHAGDLDFSFNDNWAWLHGKHYVIAGVNFIHNSKRQQAGEQTNGALSFTGASTKPSTGSVQGDDSLADMELGYVASFSQISNMPEEFAKAFWYSPYVEDQYKATKRLTVTLGLRWYWQPLPHAPQNSETVFLVQGTPTNPYYNAAFNTTAAPAVNEYSGVTNLAPGTLYSNGMLYNSGASGGLPVNFSNNHQWYFAPTGGLAWDVFGDGKTSLRGGYGISYFHIFTGQDCATGCIANPPVLTSQNLSNLLFPSTAAWNITAAGGTASAVSAVTAQGMDNNIQSTPTASYSLGLAHEFPHNTSVSVVGAGARAQHLEGTWNINQPGYTNNPFPAASSGPLACGPTGATYDFSPCINANPNNSNKADSTSYWAPYKGYSTISTYTSRLWQVWNGLEVQARHNGKSFSITGAYTYSHNTSNAEVDPYNLARYHGNTSGLNFAHTGSFTIIYHLPFFEHSNSVGGYLLKGWQINDISTFRSGVSLSPGLSMANQGLAVRPNVVAGQSPVGPKTWKTGTSQTWFNTAAFTNPAYGYYGNAQNGILTGPGQQIHNVSLFKQFPFEKSDFVEFRAEAFNVFNHTNPGNPGTTYGATSFGKITSALDPRILELAVRVSF